MITRPKGGYQGRNRGIYFGTHVTDLCIPPSDLFIIFSPYSPQSHIILVLFFFLKQFLSSNLISLLYSLPEIDKNLKPHTHKKKP